MAKTLLNGVQDVLEDVGVLDSGSALASLSDSGRQVYIDVAIRKWNEGIEELYSLISQPLPKELASSTVTLVASDRDYALASDLVQLHWPLHDQTNGQFIHEYIDGYLALLRQQPKPADYTGLPQFGVIRPTDGQVYFDKLPTSTEAGRVYTYQYDKDVSLSVAADTVPFSDAVYRAMVPAVGQLWRRERQNSFDQESFNTNLGRAARLLTTQQPRESWINRVHGDSRYDPFSLDGISG